MKKILFLGPKTNLEKGLVGGATISFGYLIDYFKSKNEEIRVLNTKRYFGFLSGLRNALFLMLGTIYNAFWADIIFMNSSRGGTRLLAPFVSFIAFLFGNKFVFRPFGGDMKDYTRKFDALSRWMFKKSVLKADILYLQTKELMDFYASNDVNTKQLKTSRKRPAEHLVKNAASFDKRFIFLGFVNEKKGVDQILEARQILGEEYTLHIYGPLKDEKYHDIATQVYKGILHRNEVLPTLSRYDVLLLPTYYEGEGYPGAIIEAYSLGLPVITTNWKSIPEMVKDRRTGILIEAKSTNALVDAIKMINKSNYLDLSKHAIQYFSDTFAEDVVLEKVRQDLKEL